jgi:hypothetical protein
MASLSVSGANDTLGGSFEPGVVVSGVTLYAGVPKTALGGGVRLNLFAELSGTEDHVCSVVIPAGFAGLVATVSGFYADAWSVYQQSTDTGLITKISLAANQCCAAPGVKIRPSLLPYAFGAEDILDELEDHFPFTPWGTGAEGAAGFDSLAGADPIIFLPDKSRILHWEATGSAPNAALNFNILTPIPRTVTVNVGNGVLRSGFPAGSIVADQIEGTNLTFATVDWVN